MYERRVSACAALMCRVRRVPIDAWGEACVLNQRARGEVRAFFVGAMLAARQSAHPSFAWARRMRHQYDMPSVSDQIFFWNGVAMSSKLQSLRHCCDFHCCLAAIEDRNSKFSTDRRRYSSGEVAVLPMAFAGLRYVSGL